MRFGGWGEFFSKSVHRLSSEKNLSVRILSAHVLEKNIPAISSSRSRNDRAEFLRQLYIRDSFNSYVYQVSKQEIRGEKGE